VEEPPLVGRTNPCLALLDAPSFWLLLAVGLGFGLLLWRPALLFRPLLWLLTHSLYRLRVTGRTHLPAQGPALLVCNRANALDSLLLVAALRRPVRLLLWTPYPRVPGLGRLLAWLRVIPLDGSAGPRGVVRGLRAARAALANGEVVCLFAENTRTRAGFLLPFHRVFRLLMRRAQVPIVPLCLEHDWGSLCTPLDGRYVGKWPQQLPYPVTVAFGSPLPPTATAGAVRQAMQKLSADAAFARASDRLPVHRVFVRNAARQPFRPCLYDTNAHKWLKYGEVLTGALLLARQLRPLLGDERMVGVWLPSSVGGALANLVLALLGKTSVNLNYTSSPDNVRSAIRQCGIRHVLTSRLFTGKGVQLPEPDLAVNLEDFRKNIPGWQRILTFLSVVVLPGWVFDRLLGLQRHRLDDVATVIFSSGSTGEPKGVVLTHQNIMANAESMIQTIDLSKDDRILGILPFFHSFGYTVTLWTPLVIRASTVYYPDPRQAKEVGDLCRTHRATILLATPTFLRFYLRRCDPQDFVSLRILVCGAEKMPQGLAREFQQKFGILPLEGYGCTELSPVATVNVPDVDIGGRTLIGNQPGTIGPPVPGVAGRIVHPDTLEPVPLGQDGLLLIFGANVMRGYLERPDLTAKAIRDGWYSTGDIAHFDEDGFVTITGRLSRFAKIGGEMVPLEKLEDELHAILGTNDRICALAAVPDEKRGERLVVLHLPLEGTDVQQLCDRLGERGLPNLWLPGARDFFELAELPLLGSGKLDLKRLKDIAIEKTAR